MTLQKIIKSLLERREASNVRSSIYTRIKLWTRALRYRGFDVKVKYDAPFFIFAVFEDVSDEGWKKAVKEGLSSATEVGLDKHFAYGSDDREARMLILNVIEGTMDITGDKKPDYAEIGLRSQAF